MATSVGALPSHQGRWLFGVVTSEYQHWLGHVDQKQSDTFNIITIINWVALLADLHLEVQTDPIPSSHTCYRFGRSKPLHGFKWMNVDENIRGATCISDDADFIITRRSFDTFPSSCFWSLWCLWRQGFAGKICGCPLKGRLWSTCHFWHLSVALPGQHSSTLQVSPSLPFLLLI